MSRRKAATLLGAPAPQLRDRSRINRWFNDAGAQPALDCNCTLSARDFVELWLEQRVSGETDWSLESIVDHLRRGHAMPFSSVPSFAQWLQRTYPDQYREGVAAK